MLTLDVRVFNYCYGQIPLEPVYFETDCWTFSDLMLPKASIASGDMFFNAEKATKIQTFLPEVTIFDMEAVSIIHVATKYQISSVVLKVISDNFNEPDLSHLQFQNNLTIMKEKICEIGAKIIKLYQHN